MSITKNSCIQTISFSSIQLYTNIIDLIRSGVYSIYDINKFKEFLSKSDYKDVIINYYTYFSDLSTRNNIESCLDTIQKLYDSFKPNIKVIIDFGRGVIYFDPYNTGVVKSIKEDISIREVIGTIVKLPNIVYNRILIHLNSLAYIEKIFSFNNMTFIDTVSGEPKYQYNGFDEREKLNTLHETIFILVEIINSFITFNRANNRFDNILKLYELLNSDKRIFDLIKESKYAKYVYLKIIDVVSKGVYGNE